MKYPLVSFLLIGAVLILPRAANAAVVINEIAWMGTAISANDEWIELYNSGADTDLTGWTLSDGISLSITLSGSISSGGHFLLERTDDETVQGKPADQIYTGALANTGSTLTLKRADGSTEDTVIGGENWERVGGDNTTKETAQYTASGWTTGGATPKAANIAYTAPKPKEVENETPNTAPKTTTSTKKPSSQSSKSTSELSVSITTEKFAYVNQPITLYAAASGGADTIREALAYSWNFGDTATGRGGKITHTYLHAGTYVVMLNGKYGSNEASARLSIEVLPLELSLVRNEKGEVTIHNRAPYEVDVSRAILAGGGGVFSMPENSILLSGAALTIPDTSVSALPLHTELALRDRAGALLAKYPTTDETVEDEELEEKPVTTKNRSEPAEVEKDIERTAYTYDPILAFEPSEDHDEIPQVAATESSSGFRTMLPYGGLIGVMIIGLLALYAHRLV